MNCPRCKYQSIGHRCKQFILKEACPRRYSWLQKRPIKPIPESIVRTRLAIDCLKTALLDFRNFTGSEPIAVVSPAERELIRIEKLFKE